MHRSSILVVLDVVAIAGGILLALWIRFAGDIPSSHLISYQLFMPLLILWRMAAAYMAGLYDFRHRLTLSEHVFGGVGAAFWGVVGGYVFLAVVQLYYMPRAELSRLVALIDFAMLSLWFALSRGAFLLWLRSTGYTVRLLLIGPLEMCRRLAGEIASYAPSPVKVLGIYAVERGASGELVLGSLTDFIACDRRNLADQVILADADLPQPELHRVLLTCSRTCDETFLFPGFNLSILASPGVQSIGGLPLIPLRPAFESSIYRPIKRVADALSALVLLILSLPLLIAGAAAVRIGSPGPVIFSQERTGLHGRVFRLYKLRTMIADAEAASGPVLSSDGDPRVTRAGRVLRKYRIDEIPQLWNVLLGTMSLVGPRPERPEFVETFAAENPLYERRFVVKPGLTGLAQIHGRYDTDYAYKLRYDLIYVNSISFLTDARILFATIRTVLTGSGAK